MELSVLLSTLELMVLHTVARLDNNAYGVPIREEIYLQFGRDVSIGALYVTLNRIENKGFLKSHMGDPTHERGGRAKKFFRITALGQEALDYTLFTMGKLLYAKQSIGG